MSDPSPEPNVSRLLERLAALVAMSEDADDLPPPDTELGRETREFFANNWRDAAPFLERAQRLRARPQPPAAAPRAFEFEIDCRFKRKPGRDLPVETADGPVRGTILYRSDLLDVPPGEPLVVVLLDPSLGYFHPNFSRRDGVLCIGALPRYPLDALLEHVYRIVTYQNMAVDDPADREAAIYFATHPEAMAGLEPVAPIY